jgi:hypothetical protein
MLILGMMVGFGIVVYLLIGSAESDGENKDEPDDYDETGGW